MGVGTKGVSALGWMPSEENVQALPPRQLLPLPMAFVFCRTHCCGKGYPQGKTHLSHLNLYQNADEKNCLVKKQNWLVYFNLNYYYNADKKFCLEKQRCKYL